jgi:hypothetical protein
MANVLSDVVRGSVELAAPFVLGCEAAKLFVEFFTASIRNPNTNSNRTSYEDSDNA